MTPAHERFWDHVCEKMGPQIPWNCASHMYKEIMHQWHDSSKTWRLNTEGILELKKIFSSYAYDTPDTPQIWINQPRVLVGLHRHMKSPYHVDHRCLTVFDNRIAMEIEVCARDLQHWSLSFWN